MSSSLEAKGSPPSVAARFETTHWSLVLKAGQDADEALLKLCRAYWPPLYSYARRRGHAVHEAQDLTQGFFAHILENRGITTVAPSKGRFRSFLLVSLKHFLDNEWHKQRAQKRGGKEVFISWDQLNPQERDAIEPSDHLSPERSFDRRWALTLLDRVVNRLRKECVAARKGPLFETLKDYLTGDSPAKSYRQIGVELGLSEGAVKVSVHRLRRRFGELVREQIERTVANPADVDDEIRQLFAALE
jgi:RNA polymerase sigma-70 factor (ECF subfamily)